MIHITFPDDESHVRALGFLAGRFSFTAYENGEMVIAPHALEPMALEGIPFSVHGPATYAQTVPVIRLRELGLWKEE